MEPEIIYKSENAILWFYPDTKIVHHKILNKLSRVEMISLLAHGTETLKSRSAHKWLSEDPPNMAYSKETLEAGSTMWITDALAAGWKYWAILKPKNVIGQLNHELLMKTYGEMGIEAQFFEDVNTAYDWLQGLP